MYAYQKSGHIAKNTTRNHCVLSIFTFILSGWINYSLQKLLQKTKSELYSLNSKLLSSFLKILGHFLRKDSRDYRFYKR